MIVIVIDNIGWVKKGHGNPAYGLVSYILIRLLRLIINKEGLAINAFMWRLN